MRHRKPVFSSRWADAAVLAAVALALIPAALSLWLSFHTLNMRDPLFSAKWNGIRHLRTFLNSYYTPTLLANSAVQGCLGILFSSVLGCIAALLVAQVKQPGIAAAIAGALLIPMFFPVETLYANMRVLWGEWGRTAQPGRYLLWHMLLTSTRLAPMVAFSGAAMGLLARRRGESVPRGVLLGCGLAVLVLSFLFLTPSREISTMIQNSANTGTSNTLEIYQPMVGLGTGSEFGSNMPQYLMRCAVQMIWTPIAGLLLWRLQKRVPEPGAALEPAGPPARRSIWVWPAAAAAGFAVVLLPGFLYGVSSGLQFEVPGTIWLNTLLTGLLAAVPAFVIALALLHYARRRKAGMVVCSALILVFMDAMHMDYLIARNLGLHNHMLSPALWVWKNTPVMVFAILAAFLFARVCDNRAARYLAGSTACLAFMQIAGSSFPALVLIRDQKHYPSGMAMREMLHSHLESFFFGFGWFAVGVGALCLLLGLLCAYLAYRALLSASGLPPNMRRLRSKQ